VSMCIYLCNFQGPESYAAGCSILTMILCPLIPMACEKSSSTMTSIDPPHPCIPILPGAGEEEDLMEIPPKYRDKSLCVRFRPSLVATEAEDVFWHVQEKVCVVVRAVDIFAVGLRRLFVYGDERTIRYEFENRPFFLKKKREHDSLETCFKFLQFISQLTADDFYASREAHGWGCRGYDRVRGFE
jgi:hypothetical protein